MGWGRRAAVAALAAVAAWAVGPRAAWAWGDEGHQRVNRAAAEALPGDAPACLRRAVERLAYLGPEPDRWREGDLVAMAKGLGPDHFVDLELTKGLVDPASPPPTRHEYARALAEGGQAPEKVGFGPYRALELCQRLEAAVASLVRLDPDAPDAPARRAQAEENVVWTAGVLGHYVADLANPHHTTIHYDGWKGPENPEGFSTERGAHARFESSFVARLGPAARVEVTAPVRADLDYAQALWAHVLEAHALVPDLYRLDRDGAFAEGLEATEVGRRGADFARARMQAGATLLRDLWATACARGAGRGARQRLGEAVYGALSRAGLFVRAKVGDDGVVTLSGRVGAPEDARRAVEVVERVPGVRAVVARLEALY